MKTDTTNQAVAEAERWRALRLAYASLERHASDRAEAAMFRKGRLAAHRRERAALAIAADARIRIIGGNPHPPANPLLLAGE